ncbi:uncharacterized protein CTRU02_204822 [Colletotrichum truncatum]|uniref:Uncharacterized protein n=1 Tax=Colletotrichum truncatum TaxID=5467 RepID=A0ACC3ZD52_COLTU|nr:uncharacterized protein CTRU02_03056 [Colletotrichum truncatum]KAF6798014.1 hypothetical protein CTRU02_03056 [Colletotrichum truncatum]
MKQPVFNNGVLAWGRGSLVLSRTVLAALFLAYVNGVSASEQVQSVICDGADSTGPWRIDPECIDPKYNVPVIDTVVDLSHPVIHRRVSGHFNDTEVDFNLYFPPEAQWQGRFFSYVYPTQNSTASDERIAFAVGSGAYLIQATGTQGYRADAAIAKFSRSILKEYYQKVPERVYGYIYGGSGGSYQTVGAIENTVGIWHGAVPIVMAAPVSIPNSLTILSLASSILKSKSLKIPAAIRTGAKDLSTIAVAAHLTEVETAILREATLLGVPLEAWEDFTGLSGSKTLEIFIGTVKDLDPSYAEDYWTKQGYLGTANTTLANILRKAFLNHTTTITNVIKDSNGNRIALLLDSLPSDIGDFTGLEFNVYSRNGTLAPGPLAGTLNPSTKTFTLAKENAALVLNNLSIGVRMRIDNSWFVALQTYHRHQVPTRAGFHGFDQYRNSDGNPKYPQRDIQIAPLLASSTAGGGTHTGNITGKVMVVDNLLDSGAFPWHADWYKTQVQSSLGDRFDENFRVYFNERANHFFEPVPDHLRDFIVDFNGIYEHALRSLSKWVEEGTLPPPSTTYSVKDSQIIAPPLASERLGIQPAVALTAENQTAQKGAIVTFHVRAEAPPGAGKIVLVEWDFLGNGNFVASPFGQPSEIIDLKATYVFEKAGDYLAVVRITSQREGDPTSAFAQARNLGRVPIFIK